MLPQPMAGRPLVLLTLAVMGAHLLALSTHALREPPRPPGMRALVTRVVNPGPDAQPLAPVPRPVDQGRAERPRVPAAARAVSASAETPAPPPGIVAAPPVETPSPAASAPLPRIDTPAASAPAPQATPAAPAIALAIPGSMRLQYAVNGQSRGRSWTLGGQLLWRHDGSQYEARLDYSAPLLPSRSQSSTGRITAEGLAPQRFSDRSRSEQATHFQRDSATLVFSNNAPPQALLAGTQDRLSVFLQLAAMLAAEPEKFPAGTGITLQTVGTRDSQPWLFTVEGDEALDLPGGRMETRKLVRNPRGDYDIRIELWLGTSMDYVPVRIRLTQPNGDFVDQQWASTDRS